MERKTQILSLICVWFFFLISKFFTVVFHSVKIHIEFIILTILSMQFSSVKYTLLYNPQNFFILSN